MVAEQTVNIVATPAMKDLAKKAMDIQDACNPRPVGNFLSDLILTIGLQNPVTAAVLNKLNDLCGFEQTRCECFTACLDLADGKDVEWVILVK